MRKDYRLIGNRQQNRGKQNSGNNLQKAYDLHRHKCVAGHYRDDVTHSTTGVSYYQNFPVSYRRVLAIQHITVRSITAMTESTHQHLNLNFFKTYVHYDYKLRQQEIVLVQYFQIYVYDSISKFAMAQNYQPS